MRCFLVFILIFSLASIVSGFDRVDPETFGLDVVRLNAARDYALTGGGSGKIVYKGKDVFRWGDQEKLYDLKSTSKSIGITALGVAIQDGRMALSDKAIQYHSELGVPPDENRDNPWRQEITIFHLAAQTAGFEKPGGYTKLVFGPGTKWNYSDGGPNWLAECIALEYKKDIQELLFERVFETIGIKRSDLRWRNNAYRPHAIGGIMRREFGSGVNANVEAMARIGWLYCRQGQWEGGQLISASFVRQASRTPKEIEGLPVLFPGQYSDASNHYGLLWWNNNDGTLQGVPEEAFWSWGLYDSIILVIPSLDLVAVRTGDSDVSWRRTPDTHHYDVLKPFFEPLVQAVPNTLGNESVQAPYPPSPVIREILWAPKDTIIRKAEGSDNWPMTWGDDDALYTAYGDGWGFEPKTERKLSLGLAKILCGPTDFQGINIRSISGEQIGQGPAGKKASGMLMVDGILYMLVRNAANSQLAWSINHGNTWTWSDWRFTESMGCPTFLNFGKNYAGARDDYVYLYSHDSDSAYTAADSMILARVPKDRIRERETYEFYAGIQGNRPLWTNSLDGQKAVFVHPGRCYRSSVSYHPKLKRYLWWQVIPRDVGSGHDKHDTRLEGGFGIYDAPKPWGPWTTPFFTERWDIGPGESACIPTQWISPDGLSFYLVFSGQDCFSVRKGQIVLNK